MKYFKFFFRTSKLLVGTSVVESFQKIALNLSIFEKIISFKTLEKQFDFSVGSHLFSQVIAIKMS
jgi:hypothetical protein